MIVILIALLSFGYMLIGSQNMGQYFLFAVFCILNTGIILMFIKDGIRKNLIYLFAFISWLLYNALGFYHVTYVNTYIEDSYITRVYLLLILSTILILLPILIAKKHVRKGFKRLRNLRLSYNAILLFLLISVGFQLYMISSAGGFDAYTNASYGAKVDSGLRTFFQLFGAILGSVGMFIMPLIFGNYGIKKKIVAISYLLFGLILSVIGGHSSGLLGTALSLFIFGYFSTNKKSTHLKLRTFALVAIPLGIIGGILIRMNRSDMSEFSLDSLNGSVTEIMVSPTFDNVVNCGYVLENMEPVNAPEQFIYPFVNFLPRAVFPWKPMELGRIVGMKYVGTTEESLAGFIPSPVGEFYYDFGYIGIIFGMLFVGFVIGYVQEKLNRTYPQSVWILAFVVSFGGSTEILYAWYTGMFTGLVRWLIFLIVFFSFNKLCRRSLA